MTLRTQQITREPLRKLEIYALNYKIEQAVSSSPSALSLHLQPVRVHARPLGPVRAVAARDAETRALLALGFVVEHRRAVVERHEPRLPHRLAVPAAAARLEDGLLVALPRLAICGARLADG